MARAALRIQDKISKGWRKEAQKLAPLWNLERYAAGETDPVVIKANIPARLKPWVRTQDIEMDAVSWSYRARFDRKLLQVNDMLVGVESASRRQMANTAERYTIVSMRLMHDNIAVRTDQKINIFRPQNRQDFGNPPNPTYSEGGPITIRDILARRIVDNVYVWIDPSTIPNEDYATAGYDVDIWAAITFGRSGAYPTFTGRFDDVPYDDPNSGWIVTCRYLPGIELRENDIVVDQTTEAPWYRVDRPYEQDDSAYINQLRCTRMRL